MTGPRRWCGAPAGVLFSIAVVAIVLAVLLGGCGTPTAAPPDTQPTVPDTVLVVPDLHAITLPATVAVTALRSTSTQEVEPPPFDAVGYVNSLPYAVLEMEPVREAYRIVASYRGWDQQTIAKWEPFIVDDVIRGESVGCWNLRGGATVVGEGHGCDLVRQGTKSDSGLMQLVSLWWRPGGPACVNEGYCSSESIIATPWDSMNAGLFAVEFNGRQSWAYDARSRAFHPLYTTVTRYWP